MSIDMKYFNVYYFCQLANESIGKFNYAATNAEFTDSYFDGDEEYFPKVSVLREYCYWLIDRVFYEQANSIDNSGEVADFNPIDWMNCAILKYKDINVLDYISFNNDCNDFLEEYNRYIDSLDKIIDGLFYDTVSDIAIEVEYILFQNRNFLLEFNEKQASAFEENPQKRVYIPEWVKRAVIFRDKGCCVFCKKDLTGLYTLLQDNEKHFDHIVPLSSGGLNDVCNIQLSCKNCNLSKSEDSKTSTLYQSAY